MEERVELSVEGGVAHVRLSRPEKRNGLDVPMFEALVAAAETVMADPSARAVVLSGKGKAFCAGLDFNAFMASREVARKLLHRDTDTSPANLAQRVGWIWRELHIPVIAALHGPVFGGGLQIALGADMRYCAPDAQLSVMEIHYGLVPDMSITKTLPPLVGMDVARELTYTGRIVDGEEAHRLGLVTRLADDPLKEAFATAETIAGRSPHAIRAAKTLWNEAPERSVKEAFELETELQLALLGTDNQREAMTAKMQKREPEFADPTE